MLNELKRIYKETHMVLNVLLFLCALYFSKYCIDHNLLYAAYYLGGLSFVLGFNFHDCIDYGRRFKGYTDIHATIRERDSSCEKGIFERSIAAYRIEQWYVMFLLGGLVWLLVSPWAVLWGFILWQFCIADLLFYLILKEPLTEMHYEWLEHWSIVAAIIKPVGLHKFIGMAIIGLLSPLVWILINIIKG